MWLERFNSFLADVQERSINNTKWQAAEWAAYREKVLKSAPIHNKDEFYEAVANALRALGDNHSYFIPPAEHKATEVLKDEEPSFSVKQGVGHIVMPAVTCDVSSEEGGFLDEKWVRDFQLKLEEIWDQVTVGWIIDLRCNLGGNMYPMIAALSPFYLNPNIGGFYGVDKEGTRKTQIIFDGWQYKIGAEQHSYSAPLLSRRNQKPVKVLIGKHTASSGEFLALSLERQPHVQLVGKPTWGVANVNTTMVMPDDLGCYMLTCAYDLDKNDEPLYQMRVDPELFTQNEGDAELEEVMALLLKSDNKK
jgi:carboxyl-terminal processing protease